LSLSSPLPPELKAFLAMLEKDTEESASAKDS
jgi:hypothetical protein